MQMENNDTRNIAFLSELNEAQRAAVTCIDHPSLVVAGAGSGKTRVLTYKIAYLLSCGLPAWNILALTFTNKASREMRERVYSLVGDKIARRLNMGTFHSVFSRLLRHESECLGYTHDYTIYDSQDSKNLIKRIVKELALDDKVYKASVVASRISLAKNHIISPAEYAVNTTLQQTDRIARMPRVADVYAVYQQQLKAANAMDFDDLLVNTFLLLKQQPSILEKYQNAFQYILVDEYQDTNRVQYQIIRLLAAKHHNITVVGDDAQSIYAFRGADIDNILGFDMDFADTKVFKLEQNYRSTQNIVDAANSLIHKNGAQIHKDVFSRGDKGDLLHVCHYPSDKAEASGIAARIADLKRSISLDDVAVLYRTNAQSRSIEDALRKLGLPYRIYGGVAFYQRREVKDALAYMRLASNLRDEESLLRIINVPARGIGDTTLRKVVEHAHQNQLSAFEVVTNPVAAGLAVSSATVKRLTAFAAMVLGWREQISTLNAFDFANLVLRESQLFADAQADTTQDGIDRLDNIKELVSSIREFVEKETQEGVENPSILDFLSEVSLLTDQDEHLNDKEHRVTLMTVHAAKGLEFSYVFIAGMEEKLFPSPYIQTIRELEEERRLFYVAITRAKKQCVISFADCRFVNGSPQFQAESSFLRDIDARYVVREEQKQKPSTFWSGWNDFDDDWQQPTITRRPSAQYSAPQPKNMKNMRSMGQTSAAERHDILTDFPVGSYVNHGVFGRGQVMAAYEENGNRKIEIDFERTGKKTLLLQFAKLTRAD